MASLLNELFCILEEETGCYQELLNMADNKTEVIIKGNVPSLQEITKKEQELAGHISRLERRRVQNLNDMSVVLNKDPKEITISKLIEGLNGEEKERLLSINEELGNVLRELQLKSETHKMLIKQSLDFVEFSLNAVQSMTNGPHGNEYVAKGTKYENHQGRNIFDAKQ